MATKGETRNTSRVPGQPSRRKLAYDCLKNSTDFVSLEDLSKAVYDGEIKDVKKVKSFVSGFRPWVENHYRELVVDNSNGTRYYDKVGLANLKTVAETSKLLRSKAIRMASAIERCATVFNIAKTANLLPEQKLNELADWFHQAKQKLLSF